jgi:hypothetical protein
VADLGHELGGQAAQCAWASGAGSNGARQFGSGVGGELSWCPAGQQLGQQHVQAVHRLGAGTHDVVAVLDQCAAESGGAQRGVPSETAVVFTIGRHAHPKARPEQPDTPAEPSGIDYLRLLDTTHTQRLESRSNYTALLGHTPINDKPADHASADAANDAGAIGGGV